ncbi:uncharacterized protein [Panulirus ornatus]|uniref:uncharacterized protein n=1 Tax=Panulirus ornatus TaxID=150431 RepID=UPI003A849D46
MSQSTSSVAPSSPSSGLRVASVPWLTHNLHVLCCSSSWISWPLAFLLQGVFDDLVDDPALPVRFRNWNTTLRLKGTSPSRIAEKIVERRSPQPSPSTSPLPPETHPGPCCCTHAVPQRSPLRQQRCRGQVTTHCTCCDASNKVPLSAEGTSSPNINGKI